MSAPTKQAFDDLQHEQRHRRVLWISVSMACVLTFIGIAIDPVLLGGHGVARELRFVQAASNIGLGLWLWRSPASAATERLIVVIWSTSVSVGNVMLLSAPRDALQQTSAGTILWMIILLGVSKLSWRSAGIVLVVTWTSLIVVVALRGPTEISTTLVLMAPLTIPSVAGLVFIRWYSKSQRKEFIAREHLHEIQRRLEYEQEARVQAALGTQRESFLMELHDGIRGTLSRAAVLLSSTGAARAMPEARAAVHEAIEESSSMIALLDTAPEEWEEFVADLRRSLGDACEAAGLSLRFDAIHDGSCRELRPQEAHALRRIAGEAVTNVLKHASARIIDCDLCGSSGSVTLQVRDDGTGIQGTSPGRGLGIIRRRVARLGGTVEFENQMNGGACLTVRIQVAMPTKKR